MNLKTEQLERLNALLADTKLDLPTFRRTVSSSGNNYQWLQRNIGIRNKTITNELSALLGLSKSK